MTKKDQDNLANLYVTTILEEGIWDKFKKNTPQPTTPQQSQQLDVYNRPVVDDMEENQLYASTKAMPQKPYSVKLLLTKKGLQEAPAAQIWPKQSANQYRGQSGHRVGQGFTFLGDEVDAAIKSGQWVLASGGNPKVPATQEEIDYRSKLPKKWSSEYDS